MDCSRCRSHDVSANSEFAVPWEQQRDKSFNSSRIKARGCLRLIQNHWVEMPAPNVFAWIGGGAVLSAAVALACWLPAQRAARVDPVVLFAPNEGFAMQKLNRL